MLFRKEKGSRISAGISITVFGILACRPVIAIGWEEFLLLFALMAFLLGPPLYRFMKRIENFWGQKKKDK